MKGDRGTLARQNSGSPTTPDALLAELRELIHSAREQVARAIKDMVGMPVLAVNVYVENVAPSLGEAC